MPLDGEHRRHVEGVKHAVHAEDADGETKIADAVHDEGLDRRRVGARPRVPEADQEIRGEAHALPAEEELEKVVRRHQHQHREGEERQKGEEARAQYEVAIQHAYTKAFAVLWKLRWATTYVREKRMKDADAAFQAAAQMAHENSVGALEAEAYRTMALYQKDGAAASRWLQKAREVLDHPHDTSRTARQQELALIYRTEVYRSLQLRRFSVAAGILAQLNKIAEASHNPNIDIAYHASAGMLLAAKQKWLEAIPHLEEDANDPFSMELLVAAYRKAGLPAKSERMTRELEALNAPSVEQALVVPEFRDRNRKSH